jgi:AAA family ATP:ADP antiporter
MVSHSPPAASPLDRGLRLFADVRPGEGLTAVLLALNIFLLLTAYYVLKPVRKALILGQGSAELKSYMSAGMVIVLAVVVPLYGRLAARVARRRLINVVTAIFAACLALFYALLQFDVPIGQVFFV